MCGIFGVVATCDSPTESKTALRLLRRVAVLSQSRGRDSSGFAIQGDAGAPIEVLRAPMAMSDLLAHSEFAKLVERTGGESAGRRRFVALGHSRLVTNGSQLEDHNNQPVIRSGIVGVHNGIVVNESALWAAIPGESPKFDIDTEALLASFANALAQTGDSAAAMRRVDAAVEGSYSVALLPTDRAELVLGTNTGSLYFATDGRSRLIFGSEHHIVQEMLDAGIDTKLAGAPVQWVSPGTARVISLETFQIRDTAAAVTASPAMTTPVNSRAVSAPAGHRSLLVDFRTIVADPSAPAARRLLQFDLERLRTIRRCSRCVLPETFPFIEYDAQGVCNYCRNYQPKNQSRPLDELRALVAPYRKTDGSQDCIVPFSGGRDSTFALHMIARELGMHPITLTYDWGMVTDLARRNIARVCGKLGVENVIVAADIKWKRENIRKNIAAWLKRPSLGMIPLFMSGDKYFFYYTNRLKQQTGIALNIWGINRLENTDFKTGFAGVPPKFDKRRIYSMSLAGHARFWAFVGSNVAMNPALINSSNLDSIGSILSRYLFPQRDYYSFFDYYAWNEHEIEDVITREYDWERAIDTDSTWRIGDGTASFYNYVYFTVAGFSENDTFRSNQIREGLLTRDVAMQKLEQENAPRYENIRWYLEIVGLDYEPTIKVINAIPKIASPRP